jgi:hypothetical protein
VSRRSRRFSRVLAAVPSILTATGPAFARAVTGAGIGAAAAVALSAPWALVLFLSDGQSLSVGETASFIDAGSDFGNLIVQDDAGVYLDANAPGVHFASNAIDPVRPLGAGAWPGNIQGETCDERFADQVTVYARAHGFSAYVSVSETIGVPGAALSSINVGTTSYNAGLWFAQAATRLATAMGKSAGVGAINWEHQESDANGGNLAYGSELVTFRANMAADLSARTGQTRPIRLYCSWQTSQPSPNLGTDNIENQFWIATIADPLIIGVGPKYQWDAHYYGGIHLDATGYCGVREQKAYAYACEEGIIPGCAPWKAILPTAFARASNVVTVTLNPPPTGGALVFDATNGRNMHASGQFAAWALGYGVEALDQRLAGTCTAVANNGSGASRLTWPGHGLTTGDVIHLGNFWDTSFGTVNVNGTWPVTVIDASHFDLVGNTYAGTTIFHFGTGFFPIAITTPPALAQVGGQWQLTVTLARAPVGSTLELSYAHYPDLLTAAPTGGWQGGLGRGGALRGTGTSTGLSGIAQYDWGAPWVLCASGQPCASPVSSF